MNKMSSHRLLFHRVDVIAVTGATACQRDPGQYDDMKNGLAHGGVQKVWKQQQMPLLPFITTKNSNRQDGFV